MTTHRLRERRIEKPWGRYDLGKHFDRVDDDGAPIGEIWFGDDTDADMPLMIKYIFTSERLSVQVHPDDLAAQASGHPRGKDEAWLILTAETGATVALGPREETSREAIKAAALDGTIVDLLNWSEVRKDQTILNTAGTVHAIGAGISLIEVQQNVDLTYRLYDYGRDRELHLLEATNVLDTAPYVETPPPVALDEGREVLCEGAKFVIERWRWAGERQVILPGEASGWFAPLDGRGSIDAQRFAGGQCWLAKDAFRAELEEGSDVLFAYPQSGSLARLSELP